MEEIVKPVFSKKRHLNLQGRLFTFERPVVMGIMNITPDSFFSGSRFVTEKRVLERVNTILQEGGQMLDIGAISTRPGSPNVSEKEELDRLNIALNAIRHIYPEVIISVDTFRASIAQWAVDEFNVNIINDISAGRMDAAMFDTVAKLNVPYIVMHMQGTPQTMQNDPVYSNAPKEVMTELASYVSNLKSKGVNDIIVDPGFGFGKTIDHNYQILNTLELYKFFEEPLLIGVSRKSMVYKLLQSTPEEALSGTTAINTIALLKGANILRVHDVKAAVDVVQIVHKMQSVTK